MLYHIYGLPIYHWSTHISLGRHYMNIHIYILKAFRLLMRDFNVKFSCSFQSLSKSILSNRTKLSGNQKENKNHTGETISMYEI